MVAAAKIITVKSCLEKEPNSLYKLFLKKNNMPINTAGISTYPFNGIKNASIVKIMLTPKTPEKR